jgi:hypothetical protein
MTLVGPYGTKLSSTYAGQLQLHALPLTRIIGPNTRRLSARRCECQVVEHGVRYEFAQHRLSQSISIRSIGVLDMGICWSGELVS